MQPTHSGRWHVLLGRAPERRLCITALVPGRFRTPPACVSACLGAPCAVLPNWFLCNSGTTLRRTLLTCSCNPIRRVDSGLCYGAGCSAVGIRPSPIGCRIFLQNAAIRQTHALSHPFGTRARAHALRKGARPSLPGRFGAPCVSVYLCILVPGGDDLTTLPLLFLLSRGAGSLRSISALLTGYPARAPCAGMHILSGLARDNILQSWALWYEMYPVQGGTKVFRRQPSAVGQLGPQV